MTTNYLSTIVKRKKMEAEQVAAQLSEKTACRLLNQVNSRKHASFAAALTGNDLAVIAEIKRSSPSRGMLAKIVEPDRLALQYCNGGAAAISVLTDEPGFAGSLDDLQVVTAALQHEFSHVPVLRKDFIVHPVQLIEAALAGASCVLLIANILKDELGDYIARANEYGLETLTEVHDEDDLQFAIAAQAPIIGVNNRNLKTFNVELSTSERLIQLIPDSCIKVAESGIKTVETAKRMHAIGYDAILVGEALVTALQPERFISEMRGQYGKN